MLSYVFTEASTYVEYKRARYNLVDVLTDVGALYTPIYAGGYMISLTFSYNLMMSSLISKLYGFEARFPEKECK
jgi:hypothetical protein